MLGTQQLLLSAKAPVLGRKADWQVGDKLAPPGAFLLLCSGLTELERPGLVCTWLVPWCPVPGPPESISQTCLHWDPLSERPQPCREGRWTCVHLSSLELQVSPQSMRFTVTDPTAKLLERVPPHLHSPCHAPLRSLQIGLDPPVTHSSPLLRPTCFS